MKEIFIGGAQRSGTTLLQLTLCQSPQTNDMLREANYLTTLLRNYQSNAGSTEIGHYFESATAFFNYHKQGIEQFLEHTIEHLRPTKALVLKDPFLAHYFPLLSATRPKAYLVLNARDPRDAIGSMRAVSLKSKQMRGKSIFPNDIDALCRHFLSFYPLVQERDKSAIPDERFMILRYEDLLGETRSTLARISTFLGLDFSTIDTSKDFNSGHVDYHADREHSPWWSEHYGKAIRAEAAGESRKLLTAEETRHVEIRCREYMTIMGYL